MNKKYTYPIIIFLIIASCIAFGQIAGNDFIYASDDTSYITHNNYVKSGFNTESIKWAFTTSVMGNWHPLTLISHMLDWKIFGANPSGHHLVSLFLHIGAVLFLFLFLNKTTNNIWPSAFAAAFFAIHPLRVESVAYAAERKDVLSMFFGMASIYSYALYVKGSKLSQYFLCLTLFILALMSKPMLVTLPFILMLLDYWPLGRWQNVMGKPVRNKLKMAGKLILEKVLFICLTIAHSILTFQMWNRDNATVLLDFIPYFTHITNALVSYFSYLGKTLWPANLALYYPYDSSLPLWKISISIIILLAITHFVLFYIKKLPFLFTGWFWYLGTLIPVIGLVNFGGPVMADRYTYLPSAGIAIMLAWSIPSLIKREDRHKNILLPAAITILTILIILTWRQCTYWKNSVEIWDHALKVTKNNTLALYRRGYAYNIFGNHQKAIEDSTEVICLEPSHAYAYYNRGVAYIKLGQYHRAIQDLNKGLNLERGNAYLYYMRGYGYAKLGQYQRAIEDFNEALRMEPASFNIYNNRGIAYFVQGKNEQGCRDVQKACELGNCKLLKWAKGKGFCP